MNNARLSIYALLLIIGLNSIICFIIRLFFSRKPKEYTYNIIACIAVFVAILILENVRRYTGVDLMISGDINKNWGSQTYAIFMLAIPVCIAIPIFIHCRICPDKIPDSGAWYCDELQVQLCFDESGDSFVVKDQKTVLCRLEIRSKSEYIYLFSDDLFEECVFSGKFLSRAKKKMRIEDRNSQWAYSFIAVGDDGTKRRKKL